MTPKASVLELAQKLGVAIVYGGRGDHFEVTAEAPEGMVWAVTGDIHEIVSCADIMQPSSRDVWVNMLGDMLEGLTVCTIPGCEWCA